MDGPATLRGPQVGRGDGTPHLRASPAPGSGRRRLRSLAMSSLPFGPTDALWHFRYRYRMRPHPLSHLGLDADLGTVEVEAGDEVVDAVQAEARWRRDPGHGVTVLGGLHLDRRSGDAGLVDWSVGIDAPPAGTKAVSVLSGLSLDLSEPPSAAMSELALHSTVWSGDGEAGRGRIDAGVSVSTRDRALELAASLSLVVLAVPTDRLEIHTPSSNAPRHGGFAPQHGPLAATIGSQRLRPLGISAFGIYLTSGHPEHPAARPLRELGISINGLVMRWHVSTAATFTRAANARATAVVPCVSLDQR